MAHSQTPGGQGLPARDIALSFLINGVLPFLIYKAMVEQVGSINALLLSAIPPLAANLIGLLRRRRIDALGAVMLTGIMLSVVVALLGGSDRLLLIRESFVTGLMGLIFLASLLFGRPIFFYIIRQFVAGGDAARIADWNANWQYLAFRQTMRLITIVWGAGLLLEATLRILLALTLPIPTFLLVSPLLQTGFYVAMMSWTFWYGSRRQRAAEEQVRESAESQPELG